MTIKYQVQPSSLVPAGVTEPYGRYQLVLMSNGQSVSSLTVTQITALMKDGGTVTLVDSDGAYIGSLQPTLSGGFLISDSPAPVPESVGVGFRPSSHLLENLRFEVSFNRVDTTYRQPIITSIKSWYQNEPYTGYVINGGHSALVVIEGYNLKLASDFHGDLFIGAVNFPNVCTNSVFITWTDKRIEYLEKLAVVVPAATGVFTYYTGDRTTEIEIPITDMA